MSIFEGNSYATKVYEFKYFNKSKTKISISVLSIICIQFHKFKLWIAGFAITVEIAQKVHLIKNT